MNNQKLTICIVSASTSEADEIRKLQKIVNPDNLQVYHETKISKELFATYKDAVFVIFVKTIEEINYNNFESLFPYHPVLIVSKNYYNDSLEVLYNSNLQAYVPYTNSFYEHLIVSVLYAKHRASANQKIEQEHEEYKSLINAIRNGTIDALGNIDKVILP